jgi:transposase InsO family protein
MPWQEKCAMDLRRSLIEDWLTDAWTLTELCATYGVSRKTAYKWLARFETGGFEGLADQSRRPHHPPNAVAPAVEAALCRARRRKPRWGPRKVRAWLIRRQPDIAWPSRVTIAAVWRRRGLSEPADRHRVRIAPPRSRTLATAPNAVWTIDFKGDFRLGSGARCYPLTLRDAATRYALRCMALPAPDLAATHRHVTRTFAEFGLPDCIRSDNGSPFAGQGLGGLSQLSLYWMRLDIRVERIDPGHPEQNGSHEQFHRMLKAGTARPPAATFCGQQRRFQRFCREYNEERPHEALNDGVPADRYTPSRRPWPTRLPPLVYPSHWDVRDVAANGCIRWRGDNVFLTRALDGQRVGLEEVDDGIWTVYFGQTPLARYLARERRLRSVMD